MEDACRIAPVSCELKIPPARSAVGLRPGVRVSGASRPTKCPARLDQERSAAVEKSDLLYPGDGEAGGVRDLVECFVQDCDRGCAKPRDGANTAELLRIAGRVRSRMTLREMDRERRYQRASRRR